jgi:type VI protein secretion system component Hcp
MKLIIILLSFLPMTIWAQKDETFARFINEDGSVIKGSSVTKNFERQIPVFNLESNSAKNSTILRFTMNTESASGVLRNLLLSEGRMPSGEIMVTYISFDRQFVRYKINMENIAVVECADSGGTTVVQLHATRIGWTYYSYTKKGERSVSSKNGWDEESGTPWNNF